MTTLFLTQDFPPRAGGIARLYGELCRRFPRGGVEVSTVAEGVAERAAPMAVQAARAVPVHRMPFRLRDAGRLTSVVRWTRWAGHRLARGDVAALQVGNIRPVGYTAAWLRDRRGVPYVIYVHGKDIMKEVRKSARSLRARRTGRWVLDGADAIIANSRATADRTESLLASLGVDPAGRVRVVHPGTDPTRFRPDARGAERWRRALASDGRPLLLTVSRLVPRKGIDTVLEALPALAAAGTAPRYAIAGTGPDRGRLERLAAESGVAEDVRFLGPVPDADLPGLYAAADVFVLPAREEPDDDEVEGFGIVLCEAQASGVPVVAGASGGVADAVRDGESGVLVAPGDAAAVADAVGALLADEAGRRRMGRAGREVACSYYHWDRAADEAWSIVEDVAARPAGRQRR